jgi:hypothetical protein
MKTLVSKTKKLQLRDESQTRRCYFAGARMAADASNKIEAVYERELMLNALDEWNGAKKRMKRWSVQDVFCCYNAFETFVASS